MQAPKLNFDSRIWKKYLEIIGNQVDSVNIRQKDDYIVVNDKFHIKPPKIQSIPEKINELRQERMEKYYKYHDLYNEILNSSDDDVSTYKKEYQHIVNSINLIETEIKDLIVLQRSINEYFGRKLAVLREESDVIERRNDLLKEQYKDETVFPEEVLNQYTTDFKELSSKQDEIYQEQLRDVPDYYIVDFPQIDISVPDSESRKKEKKYKHITADQAREIKRSVKQLISEMFKFSNLDQCLDKSRSTTYWMSKPNIIELIDNNDKLRKNMPKGYKKMKREELCSTIENLRRSD